MSTHKRDGKNEILPGVFRQQFIDQAVQFQIVCGQQLLNARERLTVVCAAPDFFTNFRFRFAAL
jgi:hypothetical protein